MCCVPGPADRTQENLLPRILLGTHTDIYIYINFMLLLDILLEALVKPLIPDFYIQVIEAASSS